MKKFTLGIVLSIVFLLTGVVNAQISTFPYAESFEAGDGGWIASGTNSSWALVEGNGIIGWVASEYISSPKS